MVWDAVQAWRPEAQHLRYNADVLVGEAVVRIVAYTEHIPLDKVWGRMTYLCTSMDAP